MAVEGLWQRQSKEGVVGVDDEVNGVDDGDNSVNDGVINTEGGGKHDNQLAKCDVAADEMQCDDEMEHIDETKRGQEDAHAEAAGNATTSCNATTLQPAKQSGRSERRRRSKATR